MTDRHRRSALLAATLLAGALAVGACAPADPPAAPIGAKSLDRFRGADGLLHDHDVRGIDGAFLPEGSLDEGLWTTAGAARLLQTQGVEPRLDPVVAARVDEAAGLAVTPAGEVQTLVGAARVCALTARTSDPCAAAVSEARRLFADAATDLLDAAEPVALIDAASDLGVLQGAPGSALQRALSQDETDDCVRSAAIRHLVRFDRLGERRTVPDPRALTDAVLAALERGDIERALCRSGLAAAAAEATPERDEDWLQAPFEAAVSAGFQRLPDGWYRARSSGLGAVEATRMLSQVSFDLSVELP